MKPVGGYKVRRKAARSMAYLVKRHAGMRYERYIYGNARRLSALKNR